MKDNTIHMVKSAFHMPFKTAMEARGISADYYFKKVNLPTGIDDPEALLPTKPFFQLINIVAIEENLPGFGSIVAQTTPWHKIESLAPLIEKSANLKELLDTFCEIASQQSSHGNFSLIDKSSHYRFSYKGSPLIKGDTQMELYRITSMIQLVQLASDAGWRPESIHLNQARSSVVNACPLLTTSKISFSQEHSSISIPAELLHLPVHLEIPTKTRAGTDADADADKNNDFANSIRNIINTYSQTQNISIEETAELAEMSVRTLQRRLAESNLHFNQMVGEAKLTQAKIKLKKTDIPIKEIARMLGYSDTPHFTRAFKRWTGISPSDFRTSSDT
jgi:AraC-like DNA-binding protein